MIEPTDMLPLDMTPEVESRLRQAGAAWEDEDAAERLVLEALALAPDSLATRMAAYKFYFYRHRLEEALPHAASCLDFAAGRLGLSSDWREVGEGDGDFAGLAPLPKLWLQALTAYGYVLARLGDLPASREALAKVVAFDGEDKLGAARLLAVVAREGRDEED